MLIFKKVSDLQAHLDNLRQQGLRIGFVPTMGALHTGHLSLLKIAKMQSDITVCSIFVNPTQFNDAKDLQNYPRTTAEDIHLLNGIKTDVLLMPPVEEIYPAGLDTSLDISFDRLEQVLEGEFRPGHFQGMAQVVKRLLDIVRPDQLFMGQKDFQQVAIVRNMLQQLKSPIDLVMCPIVREQNGLAMSSRNRRLLPEHFQAAALIHQTLKEVTLALEQKSPSEVEAWALRQIQVTDFRPEYFRIVDGRTLLPVNAFVDSDYIVACTAVWVGEIRLIDNEILVAPASEHLEDI